LLCIYVGFVLFSANLFFYEPTMKTAKTGLNDLSWKKRIFFKFLLLLAGTVFALLLAEVVLRVIGYSSPVFYSVDESRGFALTPNMKGWYRKEGTTYIEINSDGLRDEEHLVAKPENTVRIAVIGDSYSEALQVSLNETFWKVMQQKLAGCNAFGGKRVEVINFGVSGYGTAQEYLTLKEKVWKYSPDIVLLAVTTNNDITDNYRKFKGTEIPYFVYKDDELALDDSFRNSAGFRFNNSFLARAGSWLRDNLRVIQGIQEGQTALKYWWSEWKKKPAPAAAPDQPAGNEKAAQGSPRSQAGDIGIDNQIYRVPKDDQWNEAWRVTEGLILKINEEVRGHNAKFVVVTLSNGAQVYPDPKARADLMAYLGVENIFYPDERIKNFAGANSIPVVTLAPALQAYAEQNHIFLHGFEKNLGFGHWNQAGHQKAGEILGETFCNGF
jgi:hypothetical protein